MYKIRNAINSFPDKTEQLDIVLCIFYYIQTTKLQSRSKTLAGEADTSSEDKTMLYDNEGKDEPDFIETNCHWKDCDKEFKTQDELVRVSFQSVS